MEKGDKPQPLNDLKWVRHSNINPCKISHITGNLLLFGHGSAITILNIDDDDAPETTHRIAKPQADGVACVAGHPQLPLFAFAEHSNEARIFVVHWPDFRALCTLAAAPPLDGHGQPVRTRRRTRRILSMAFSESEHLAVLTGFPDFVLEVWNWRTQRKLTEQATGVFSDLQYIECAPTPTPLCIVQCAHSLGLTYVWEVHLAVDAAALIRRTVPTPSDGELQPPFDCCLLPDGGAYITNRLHSVWHVHAATKRTTLVVDRHQGVPVGADTANSVRRASTTTATASQRSSRRMSRMSTDELFAEDTCASGLLAIVRPFDPQSTVFIFAYRGGIGLIEMDGMARFYRRAAPQQQPQPQPQPQPPPDWLPAFCVPIGEPVLAYECVHMRTLLVYTASGLVRRLLDDDGGTVRSWKTLRDYGRDFAHVVMVQPLGELIVTVSAASRLRLVRTTSGQVLDTLRQTHIGLIQCLAAHPGVPVVAVGTDDGWMHLLSLFSGRQIEQLTGFHLSEFAVAEIMIGPANIVVRDASNALFVISGTLGQQMTVTNHVQLSANVLSMTAVWPDATAQLTIVALLVPIVAPNKPASDRLLRVRIAGRECTQTECTLPREYVSVAWTGPAESMRLSLSLSVEAARQQFVAVPYLSNYFDVVEVAAEPVEIGIDAYAESARSVDAPEPTDEVEDVSTVRSIEAPADIVLTRQTMHRVCLVRLAVGRDTMLTWSQDGAVQLWSTADWTAVSHVWALNHYATGVRQATVDPVGLYMVTLGSEGNLQCVQHSRQSADSTAKLYGIRQQLASVAGLFASPTKGFVRNFSWVVAQRQQSERNDNAVYSIARLGILTGLAEVSAKLRVLIDANETAPIDEQLAIEQFDLDAEGSCRKRAVASDARAADQTAISGECVRLAGLAAAITERTWDRMTVKGRNLRGVFTRQKVENYALLREDESRESELKRVQQWRAVEQARVADGFQPWQPFDALRAAGDRVLGDGSQLTSQTTLARKDSKELVSLGQQTYSLSGTSSHRYIAPEPMRYRQLEVISYYQMVVEAVLGRHDTLALRHHFNRHFAKMTQMKDDVLQMAIGRHQRLRHIQSELNQLEQLRGSDQRHDRPIEDPVYAADEQPERIVRVEAHELSVEPWVSPEEQARRDAIAAELERLRLERLADDFRERALQRMMNGVLEIRWEDEIKKQPPQADCVLSGKNPKDYTPEDLRAICDYEQQVEFLEGERERYWDMLVQEQSETSEQLFAQLRRFNHSLGETLIEKIKVEFAIAGEDLKVLRMQLFNWERLRFADRQRQLEQEMTDVRCQISTLSATLEELESGLVACRAAYEELSNKDRTLERHFKVGFAEYASKALADQAYRIFRRRPKWTARAWQTASILTDMARRIINADATQNRGAPLPDECFQFLLQIEQADRAAMAPNVLDAQQWRVLCRLRRIKLEMEFRVRAVGAQVADAESSVNAFVREIAGRRQKLGRLEAQLTELVAERNEHLVNRNVQLCMRRAGVEIALSGLQADFSDAILLHRSDVMDINEIIKKAGEKKLATMRMAAIFRRKIIRKEWEHRVLRLQIAEKRAAIKCIQRTKITKEVQHWLKWKALGWPQDLSEAAISRETEANRANMEAMCNAIVRKLNETRAQEAAKRQTNAQLDRRIQRINLRVAELQLGRDVAAELADVQQREQRFAAMTRRARLVREIQRNHACIVELCAMLEVQRMRTFPTLRPPAPPPDWLE